MSQTLSRVRHSSLLLLGMTILLLTGCSGDGGGTGGPTGAACQSNCPTAEAGREQAVLMGAPVTLDGSGSTSGTPGLITYQWTLLSKPTGSAATLAGATTARPTFTADVAGTYAARLVVHEGGVASPPDTVTITCGAGNLAPMADAGLDRTEQLGTRVTLDGTGSRDPNGTPITYAWRVVTQPSGSQAVLLTPTTKTPSFTPQVVGPYTLALTVSDSALTSPSDEVTITVTNDNCPPIAHAGPDQTVTTGQVVTLTGAGSTDPNDDPLTYSWRFQSKPDGSTATVAAATVSPTFTADLAGLYVLSLVVSDGMRTSAPDTVVIDATLPGSVNLVLEAYVKASNSEGGDRVQRGIPISTGDQFGFSVALSEDTLVVGARHEDSCATGINGDQANNGCEGAGAVYVFTRTNGVWKQQAYLKPSNVGTHGFGQHVVLSGDTLAATAGDSAGSPGVGVGVVYVFTRSNGTWSQQAHLKASHVNQNSFASSLALDGDTLAVGALADNSCATGINGDPSITNCSFVGPFLPPTGAAFVFTRTNGVWSQQAYIKPAIILRGLVEYTFGKSVAISGDTLAVGAPTASGCGAGVNSEEGRTDCGNSGAAYVFIRRNGAWTQDAFIKASNPELIDSFGLSVALSGDTLAVTALNEGSCATGINGNQANNDCLASGAAYVFIRAAGSWSQQAYVKPSNTKQGLGFGESIALQGDTLAVGAEQDSSCATGVNGNQLDNGCFFAGAVYLFNRRAGVWTQQAYVKASNTDSVDGFGGRSGDDAGGVFRQAIALSNGTLAVGAFRESSCARGINGNQSDNSCVDAGAAYVYRGQ